MHRRFHKIMPINQPMFDSSRPIPLQNEVSFSASVGHIQTFIVLLLQMSPNLPSVRFV